MCGGVLQLQGGAAGLPRVYLPTILSKVYVSRISHSLLWVHSISAALRSIMQLERCLNSIGRLHHLHMTHTDGVCQGTAWAHDVLTVWF